MKNRERLLWIAITTTLLFFLALPFEKAKAFSRDAEKYLQIFHEISTLIETDYVETIEDKKIMLGAIKGMIGSLGDAHTRFMEEDDFKQLQEETRGSFGGVGLEVTQSDGTILVITPIDDTPAQRAGILPQDRILEINGNPTNKMNIQEAVKMMRGPTGSSVTIKIQRKSLKEPIFVTLNREQIKIQFLKSEFLENDKIGYIRLSQFMGRESTLDEFKSIISNFQKKNAKGFIIDLRSNPGGLLDLSIDLSDLFLKRNLDIVSVKGRGEKLIKIYKSTDSKEKFIDLPLVVLVNNGSASASEIFAGAMQDHKRGIILGNQTFGKGSVQNIYPLPHRTGIALTIQKYYTPSGVSIHKKGIKPDYIINQINPQDDERTQIDKIIKQNLIQDFVKANPDYNEDSTNKFIETLTKKGFKLRGNLAKYLLKRETNIGKPMPVIDREFDNQLNKAIDLLNNKPISTEDSNQEEI
jgi:carboxyl-terminal processing protease